MGKASSSKKVARAARTGGKVRSDQPKLGYPLAVFAIVVLGSLMVFGARASRDSTASAEAPSSANSDHWHAAYGFYVCDHFLDPVVDASEDKLGIHTHGDGIIHIHPFTEAASGDKARLKIWGDQVGVQFTDDGWVMPDGTEYKTGYDCNGQPGKFAVYRWVVDDGGRPVDVYETNIENIRFDIDRSAYTFAVIPEGSEPPPPPASIPELNQLVDVDTGAGAANGETTPPPISIPTDASGLTTDSLPTDSLPTDSLPTDSLPTDSLPTDSLPGGAAPTESAPAQPAPTESTP